MKINGSFFEKPKEMFLNKETAAVSCTAWHEPSRRQPNVREIIAKGVAIIFGVSLNADKKKKKKDWERVVIWGELTCLD